MGMLDRFGRIADTYMSEKDRLIEADPERRRVFVCLLYTSPSPRDRTRCRMPSSA